MSKSQKPVKKFGSKSSKHHKKKKAKVAEKEKEKPKKRKAKHIILSEEEEDEEVDSEWIPERHAGEVEVTTNIFEEMEGIPSPTPPREVTAAKEEAPAAVPPPAKKAKVGPKPSTKEMALQHHKQAMAQYQKKVSFILSFLSYC